MNSVSKHGGKVRILFLLLFLSILHFLRIESPKEVRQQPISGDVHGVDIAVALAELQLPESAVVVSVTDGDTFKVKIDDKVEVVRLVGINTPETVDPRKPVECFGVVASDTLKQLLIGQKVRLIPDATQSDRDRYGRLLRFAQLEGGSDVGLQMIEQGFAEESLYSQTPHKMHQQYVQAEQMAREASRGLWSDTACARTESAVIKTELSLNCTGPDLDCSDFVSQTAAQNFFQNCGFTVQKDPMNLDGVSEGDGIACEGLR